MRMIMDFIAGIRRSMERAEGDHDPVGAARMLESAVGNAVDLDGEALLSLAPESIATVMQISGCDPHVTEYVARSLMLASQYYAEAGESTMADLRQAQAEAVASAYGHELGTGGSAEESMRAFLDSAQ